MEFNSTETFVLQKIWESLNFYNKTGVNVRINDIRFKFTVINDFKSALLNNQYIIEDDYKLSKESKLQIHKDIDLIDYQFDQLIQLLTIIVINLDYPSNYYEIFTKFAKINNRIYNLNITVFCQLLLTTILKLKNVGDNEYVLIKFLKKFNENIDALTVDPIIEENPRLSLSNSNVSNLSLNNDNTSVFTTQSPLSRGYFKDNSSLISNESEEVDQIETDEIDLDSNTLSTKDNHINIDDLEDLEQAFTTTTNNTSVTYESDDSEDSTFDYLNSFNQESDDKNKKKLKGDKKLNRIGSRASIMLSPSAAKSMRRLSSANLKTDLTKISTRTSRKRKDDCTIM
ncbi:hypothetical protein CLIB1444_02S06326 [[Candida] jaroonii]|uniref:Uncharacterized protein n=1 Tax=[Candida] jaroonii TaxID=467808 RepID=A0ACA9Y324_9ASCO|nr:hypothetical protein CLIB1444_02S06326 [[Candida] jaroonii]